MLKDNTTFRIYVAFQNMICVPEKYQFILHWIGYSWYDLNDHNTSLAAPWNKFTAKCLFAKQGVYYLRVVNHYCFSIHCSFTWCHLQHKLFTAFSNKSYLVCLSNCLLAIIDTRVGSPRLQYNISILWPTRRRSRWCSLVLVIWTWIGAYSTTMASWWTWWCLKSPASRLFTQLIIQLQIKKKHQSYASLAFVLGIHRCPANSLHKEPETHRMGPFDDAMMGHFKQTNRLPNMGYTGTDLSN